MRNFSNWIKNFKKSIINESYFVDWKKIKENVEKYKIELNILNSLIGSNNIVDDFKKIIKEYPKCVECIPLLIAKRELYISTEFNEYDFNKNTTDYDSLTEFMEKSGLFDFLLNKNIKNIYDYLMGVEVGLDSNARKNRTGIIMEDKVEDFLKKSKIKYDKQIKTSEIATKYNIDLTCIDNNKIAPKKFDFVFKIDDIIYACEVNYFNVSGSKLNEVARSYKEIANITKNIKNFKFMWITDGLGWNSAKNNLHEVFNILDHLYNINNLENGALEKLVKWKQDIYKVIDS